MNKKNKVLVAAAVAGLIGGGLTLSTPAQAGKGYVKCSGINSCAKTGDCHTYDKSGKMLHACAGQNKCKGKAWKKVASEKACKDKGGTVIKKKG